MTKHPLVPVFTGTIAATPSQLCNARDLHRGLGVGRDFTTWIKERIAEYGFTEIEDFIVAAAPPIRGAGNRGKRTDYHLTLDMAKELAMIENNDTGRKVRRYFIQAEEALLAELRDKANRLMPLPGIKFRARDGLRLKETLILRDQSRKSMDYLLAATHPAQRTNLWHQLKQVNDALGIPTPMLTEIDQAPLIVEGVK